ncbi:hypothetical protein OAK67_02320 [Crocinitomicaceae bacterium]|nr:hypothetical protein [Crocinitomicaceae bacterium]
MVITIAKKSYLAEAKNALPNSKVSRTNVAKYLVDSLLDSKSGKFSICDE